MRCGLFFRVCNGVAPRKDPWVDRLLLLLESRVLAQRSLSSAPSPMCLWPWGGSKGGICRILTACSYIETKCVKSKTRYYFVISYCDLWRPLVNVIISKFSFTCCNLVKWMVSCSDTDTVMGVIVTVIFWINIIIPAFPSSALHHCAHFL